MKLTIVVLQKLIENLSRDYHFEPKCEYLILNFFDNDYPIKLKPYAYHLPVIYYIGDSRLFRKLDGVIVSQSPSYYVQKVLSDLNRECNLIPLKSGKNSITKDLYLCDIIYCNDISDLVLGYHKLKFCLGPILSEELQLQVLSILINRLFVLEGYINNPSIRLINDCADNHVEIIALPTNIYISCGRLPNRLIASGVIPYISN